MLPTRTWCQAPAIYRPIDNIQIALLNIYNGRGDLTVHSLSAKTQKLIYNHEKPSKSSNDYACYKTYNFPCKISDFNVKHKTAFIAIYFLNYKGNTHRLLAIATPRLKKLLNVYYIIADPYVCLYWLSVIHMDNRNSTILH